MACRLSEPNKQTKSSWSLPYARAWNIGLRTVHIALTGILVGGHLFAVSRERLLPWLFASIASGVALTVIEASSGWHWFYQGRGLFVLSKLLLLCAIPWFWDYRVLLLLCVVAIGSVGSHMPGRFRYYSVPHRRVLCAIVLLTIMQGKNIHFLATYASQFVELPL